MSKKSPKSLIEFQDIYGDFLERERDAIVAGYWHLKKNRHEFSLKTKDFKNSQVSAEAVIEGLEILISKVEGDRDKPGVQPMVNHIVSILNIHLDRISKYYPANKPDGFKHKDNQRDERTFQREVFNGERKLKDILKNLDIENDMSGVEFKFFDSMIATLPMKSILCSRDSKIAAKCESLDIDWDLIMDNKMFINMNPRDIPDYNEEKHFWDQEKETLQFFVSEWNKINRGVNIDGYEMTPSMYFHLNYFKTPIKNQGNKITNPPLRDNEWYFDEIKKYAKKEAEELRPAAIILYGSRRWSKTTLEVSHIHHGILIYSTENGTMTSTNETDLNSLVDKLKKSQDNIHPAFRLNILSGKDYKKEVLYGLKSGSGRISYEHFTLGVTNTDGGSQKGGQKTAGGNPKVYVSDEIGKDRFLKSHRAAVPSFESDNGWVCQPLYTGTAGEEDLSKDAETVLRDPEGNDFIKMKWDILEYGIPKEYISWNRRTFGWFLPAQMSIKTGHRKIKTNLADFLNIESEELSKIDFYKTDWKHNLEVIKNRRKALNGDDLQQEIVFRPIDPEECFMSAKKNPYPAQGIKRHKEKLQSQGDKVYGLARKIDLFRNENNPSKIEYELSNKDINEYPHNGSFTDHCALLYGDFPEERPYDPYRFVAGFDDVKQDESDGDSIPSFYIFDRLTRKLVFSLANRSNPKNELYKQMHMALDAWNAKCFMENEDMDFKKYLDRVSDPSLYLYKGFDAYDDFSKFQNGKRKFGWRPDKNTVPIIRGYTLDYVKDNIDYYDSNDKVTHTVSGYERIEDIQLLEEMINYKPDGNFDRLVGFGSCLAIDYYLTSNYITPQTNTQKNFQNQQPDKITPPRNKFFTNKRRSPFTR